MFEKKHGFLSADIAQKENFILNKQILQNI